LTTLELLEQFEQLNLTMNLKQIVWSVLITSLILIFVSVLARKPKAKSKVSSKKIGGRGVKTMRSDFNLIFDGLIHCLGVNGRLFVKNERINFMILLFNTQ